jgi:hypothetical protein
MSGIADSEHDAQKRGLTNIKGLWRDAFQTLKTSTTSSSSRGSGSNESRLVRYRILIDRSIYACLIHVRCFYNRVIQTKYII